MTPSAETAAGVGAPNILWIVTTQWRAAAAGYAGDANARTPRLDALAASAVNFAQAVTPHPFGPFARAALLTGVPSPENGVRDYFDPLPSGARTIAHDLAARGYATAFFGKWHLYRRDPAAPMVGPAHAKIVVPPDCRGGFSHWTGFESGFLLNDPWLHGTSLPEPVQFPGYQSDVVCDRAGEWIGDFGSGISDRGLGRTASHPAIRDSQSPIPNISRPWFVIVSLEPPHPPYDAPAAGVAPRPSAAIELAPNVPRGGAAEARARRELAGYYAHLEATDRAIGRLLDRLPAAGTVVVFTSVHGDMHGAHGRFRKGWPHEESVRVPLLVRGASRGEGSGLGTRSDEPVSLMDLHRWTLDWAGAAQPRNPNSEPRTEMQRISMPSVVRLPHQCDRVWRGVRSPGRKLVVNADGTPWLYFRLDRDPGEQRNLADDPAQAAEIAALRRWL